MLSFQVEPVRIVIDL